MNKLKAFYKKLTISDILRGMMVVVFVFSFLMALRDGEGSKAIWIGIAFFWFLLAQFLQSEVRLHHKVMEKTGVFEMMKKMKDYPSPKEIVENATIIHTTTMKEYKDTVKLAFERGKMWRSKEKDDEEVMEKAWEENKEDTLLIISTDNMMMYGSLIAFKERESKELIDTIITAKEYAVQSK